MSDHYLIDAVATLLTWRLGHGGSVVTESPQEMTAVRGQIQLVARKQYSNPPIHGALIVTRVLSNPDLKQLWYKEVQVSALHGPRFHAHYAHILPCESLTGGAPPKYF